MFGDHFGRVLNGVARLFVGAGGLEYVRGEHVPDTMGPVW